MEIIEKFTNNIAVLTVKSSIISEVHAHQIQEKMQNLLGRNIKYIVLNLGEVIYMSSLGIGVLVASMTTLRKIGGDLRLVCLSKSVQNSFTITRLALVFRTYETAEEAVASFKSEM